MNDAGEDVDVVTSAIDIRRYEPLTERQQAIYIFIRDAMAKHGWPPTIREIGEHFGFKSTMGASDHLRALKKKGWITIEFGKSRGIRLRGPVAKKDGRMERLRTAVERAIQDLTHGTKSKDVVADLEAALGRAK